MTEAEPDIRFSQLSLSKDASHPVSESYSVSLNDSGASPSRTSSISTSSYLNLKRRTGQTQMRNILHTARPSINDNIISSILTPNHSNHVTISRSNTAPSPKRAPASHSSYGVETSSGPPPSFDTRRTSSTERVWRIERPKTLRVALALDSVESYQNQGQVSQQPEVEDQQILLSTNENSHQDATPSLQSSPETADTQSINTPTDVEDVTIMEGKFEQGLGVRSNENDAKSSSGSHKSEDLFLNIARTDERPSSSKGDRRRSRIGLQYLSTSRPNSSHRSQNSRQMETIQSPETEVPAYRSKRSSLQFGQLRGPEVNADHDLEDSNDPEHYSNRDTLRPTTRSSVIYRNNRLVSEPVFDKAVQSEQNATESTASTNAPSTVWDELDDLKSRIRKLELTGKLPPSSAAAMSSAERPRTATTAATTMSTSPKHNKVSTPLQSTFEGISPNMHPLLHEALGNAKQIVSHDVYQKLQATAQDALQLSSLTAFDSNTVRTNSQLANERQIRRRTESMCRSLTELAIALAAEQKTSAPTAYRPPSRELSIAGSTNLRSRRYSQSNDPPSARIASRLETRRISTQYPQPRLQQPSPEIDSPTALPQYPGSGSRISRGPASVRARRAYDGADDSDAASAVNLRPVSRAMTDISSARRLSRDHTALSREYTAQHPMPDNFAATNNNAVSHNSTRTPVPANISTNFISRRKTNFSPDGPESSPLAARPSFGRITVVQNQHQNHLSDTASDVGRSNTVGGGTRRSLGFASRLGSSVGNRLRAARTERLDSRYRQDGIPVDPASIQM